jgi:hypothetical protein
MGFQGALVADVRSGAAIWRNALASRPLPRKTGQALLDEGFVFL